MAHNETTVGRLIGFLRQHPAGAPVMLHAGDDLYAITAFGVTEDGMVLLSGTVGCPQCAEDGLHEPHEGS